MSTILLIIHLLIALTLVGVILLQRSEGGALGIGGGGMGGLMSGRSSANLLTRTTASSISPPPRQPHRRRRPRRAHPSPTEWRSSMARSVPVGRLPGLSPRAISSIVLSP